MGGDWKAGSEHERTGKRTTEHRPTRQLLFQAVGGWSVLCAHQPPPPRPHTATSVTCRAMMMAVARVVADGGSRQRSRQQCRAVSEHTLACHLDMSWSQGPAKRAHLLLGSCSGLGGGDVLQCPNLPPPPPNKLNMTGIRAAAGSLCLYNAEGQRRAELELCIPQPDTK